MRQPQTDEPSPGQEAVRKPRFGNTFASLAERDFAWFFAGNFAFFMAMQMQMILYGYLAFELTGAAKALGVISAAHAIPTLIASPFSGALADRLNKRLILAITQLAGVVITVFLACLIIGEWIKLWQLAACAVVLGLCMSLNMPTRQALVPQLVPRHRLMNAISLQMAEMNLTRIIAPALAGILIAPLGLGWVFLLAAALYGCSLLAETRLPKHGMTGHTARGAFMDEVKDGFRYIWGHRTVRLLLLVNVLVPMFSFPVQQTLPVFASEVFDRGPAGLGVLAAMSGVGGFLGAVLAANMDGQPRKGRLMLLGGLLMGVMFIGFALAPSFYAALPFLAIASVGQMLFMTTNNTVIQASISPEMRGRVMSVLSMSIGLTPLGVFPIAVAIDEVGAPLTIAVASCLLLVLLITLFRVSKTLRTLRLDPLERAQLSPVQAAAAVAEGRLSQAEADRLSGRKNPARNAESGAD